LSIPGESSANSDREGGRLAWWLDANLVIDSTTNPLFAAEISFGCLNGNVTEQKLDLL